MSDSVLIIDDSPTIREKIIKILEANELFSRFYEAEDGLDGFKKLLSSPVDVVLCDLEMPRMDGFKFLGMIKSRNELKDLPVIILTGVNEKDKKIKGLEQGAIDFVIKPFDPEELVARLRVHLKIKHLQDDLKRSNEMLLELSNTDHLTGLFNRRYLMESLVREVQRNTRKGGALSVMILDIDHFKRINDTYGHLQGDVVLQKVASQIQKSLRSYDIAARYGGEEFFLILPESNQKEAAAVADRLRQSIQEMTYNGALNGLTVTDSFGVSSVLFDSDESIDDLIKRTDENLYRAKNSGRNRVECDQTS